MSGVGQHARSKEPNLIFIRGIYVSSVHGFYDDTAHAGKGIRRDGRVCACVLRARVCVGDECVCLFLSEEIKKGHVVIHATITSKLLCQST